MNWYNQIAFIYDFFSKKIYTAPRKELIENLDLNQGDKILLVACGTGLGLDLIESKILTEGLIVGIDSSEKMLALAQKKVDRKGWKNVILIHADLRLLSKTLIRDHVGNDVVFDKVIGELAFSVIPDWKIIMRKTIELLKKGGKIGVLDGYRGQKDIWSQILNLLPKSDISRNISSHLSTLTDNYWRKRLGRTKILFVGIGSKK